MIKIRNLNKKYTNDNDFVLDIKSLDFPSKGLVFIYGNSGSGKSTLLNLLTLIDSDYSGEIMMNGRDIRNLNDEEKTFYKKKIFGYVHQSPLLLNQLTVQENLLSSFNNDQIPEKYNLILDALEIKQILKNRTTNLSGGEKQRVALARVLLDEPYILFADEPTGNLDNKTSKKVMDLLKEYSNKHLVIIVTHDIDLIKEYEGYEIEIKDGKILYNSILLKNNDNNIWINKDYKISRKFGRSLLNSLFHTNKMKNSIFMSFLSLALISISCTFIIKNNIESSLTTMFSNYFTSNEILMEQKGLDPSTYNRYDSIEESYVKQICENYDYLIDGYKYIYETNFLNLFTDLNDVRLVQTYSSTVIQGFDSRNFNEFLLTEYIDDFTYVDHLDLKDDEIILSLNDKQIYDICYSLHIQRNNESLFNYVKEGKFQVSLNVRNVDIGYDNEVLFTVAGFVNENRNLIYHSNPLFNVNLFEKEMQLDSTLYQDGEKNPWTMKKSAVLIFFEEKNIISFLKQSHVNSFLSKFYFNVSNSKYYPKTYENIKDLNIFELVAYIKTKQCLDTTIINKLEKLGYKNIRFSSYGGYLALGNELLNGFSNQCFLSNNLEKLQEISDLYESNYKLNISVNDIDGVVQGGINSKTNHPLQIKYIDNLNLKISANGSDIYISSYLSKLFSDSKNLKFSYAESFNNSVKFSYLDFNVIGVIENDTQAVIYADPYFSILLFQYLLRFDFNKINLKNIVFNIDDEENLDSVLHTLNNSFNKFSFSSPFSEVKKEINVTLDSIQIILIIFSILSSLISLILIIVIARNIIDASYRDIAILYVYGINIKDSLSFYTKYIFILGIISYVVSIIFGYIISFLIEKVINNQILNPMNMIFNSSWILINLVVLFGFISVSIISMKRKIEHINLPLILSK